MTKLGFPHRVALVVVPAFLLFSGPCPSPAAAQQSPAAEAEGFTSGTGSGDWLTWGGGPQRHSWARSETILSRDNVSNLELKWVAELDNPAGEVELATVTNPLVATGIPTAQGAKTLVYVVGSKDIVYALDSDTGEAVWRREIPRTLTPEGNPNWLCPLSQNATPVIDKEAGIIYVLTSEGKLIGLDLSDGSERMAATEFVTPFSRNWSLNLVDGWIYTTLGRGCGGAAAETAGMNIEDPAHPVVRFNTSDARPSGAWGRGGPVLGPRGLYLMTATGPYDPATNQYGDSFVLFELETMRLLDHFSPARRDEIRRADYGGSASPVVFPFRDWELVVGTNKESIIYILDSNSLGGEDNETALYESPRWGNDQGFMHGRGVWGAMATWEDSSGERWLYVPMWGPPVWPTPEFQYIHGMQDSGSIMAFRVGVENDMPTLIPVWMSASMAVPEPPIISNGVVFSLASGENTRQREYGASSDQRFGMVADASLHAFDAFTGEELYDSGSIIDDWSHFGALAVAEGRIYFTTNDSRVYSFGLP